VATVETSSRYSCRSLGRSIDPGSLLRDMVRAPFRPRDAPGRAPNSLAQSWRVPVTPWTAELVHGSPCLPADPGNLVGPCLLEEASHTLDRLGVALRMNQKCAAREASCIRFFD
jgi:hypothetical protein